MPGEEPGRVVPRELRDAGVPAHVGVQRLLLGAEGVEQVQCQLPVVSFVVPLQQDVQRNRDLTGLVDRGAGHETPGEETGGREARFDQLPPHRPAAAMIGSASDIRIPMAIAPPEYPTGPLISGSERSASRVVCHSGTAFSVSYTHLTLPTIYSV